MATLDTILKQLLLCLLIRTKVDFLNHNGGKRGGHSKKERPICTYCGLTGHIADKCYKLHEYPPGCKPKGEIKAMANQVTGNFGNFDALTALINSHI